MNDLVPEKLSRNSLGVQFFFFLKILLKLDMLLNPHLYAISAIVCVLEMSSFVACPNRISFRLSINVLPVRFLINLLKDTSGILATFATSSREIPRL